MEDDGTPAPPPPPLARGNELTPRSREDRAQDAHRMFVFQDCSPSFSLVLNHYSSSYHKTCTKQQQFIFWCNGAAPHLKMWTAAFVDTRTGEVFLAAPRMLDLDVAKQPVFESHLWWFQQKKHVKDAVAARAVDCFVYREKDEDPSVYGRYSAAQPYLPNDEEIPLSELPFWFTLLPKSAQQSVTNLQRGIQDVPSLAVMPPIEEAEDAWHEQQGARPSVRDPRVLLFQYFIVIRGIRLEDQNYVFWKWWSEHDQIACVLVCPLSGELFSAAGPSADQAGVNTAGLALQVIKDRQDLELGIPPPNGLDYADLEQDTEVHPHWENQTQIRLLQARAVHPPPSVLRLQPPPSTQDLPQIGELDENQEGKTPLVLLGEWLQKREKKSVPRSSFVTFAHEDFPQNLVSCVWVNPVTGEICLPEKLDVMDEGLWWANVDDDQEDEQSLEEDDDEKYGWKNRFEQAMKRAKSKAKMAVTVSALAQLKWRARTNQPYDVRDINTDVFQKVPRSACEEILRLADQACPAVSSTVLKGREVMVNLDPEEPLPNHASMDMKVASGKVNRHSARAPSKLEYENLPADDEPVMMDTKPNQCSDYQPLTSGNPVRDLAKEIYRIPKCEDGKFKEEQFTLWWKLSDSWEILWTGVFECPDSSEVFLSTPFARNSTKNNNSAEKDMRTGLWWFRSKIYALRSAAARAFDIHCIRKKFTETERYCDQEVLGNDENVTLSDLASIAKLGLHKKIAFQEPTEEPVDE